MLLLQGAISAPPSPNLCVIGHVRFERNWSKMYSRHLFPYGGLIRVIFWYSGVSYKLHQIFPQGLFAVGSLQR